MNYLKKVSENADKVYAEVVKQKCMHGSGAKTFAEIKTKKKITCAGAVSSTLKLAGLLGDGYVGSTSGINKDEGSKKLATEEYVDTKLGAIESLADEILEVI